MPKITSEEEQEFSASQLAELNRMSDSRQSDLLNPSGTLPEEEETVRAAKLAEWKLKTPGALKILVNIDGFGNVISFSSDSNYSDEEKDAITFGWAFNQGRKPNVEIPFLLALDAQMVTDSIGADIRKAILMSRGG